MSAQPLAAQAKRIELTSQERSVHGKLPELRRILETYAEKLRVMVSKLVWQPAPVTIGQVDIKKHDELEAIVRAWPTGAHIVWPQVGTVGYLGLNPLFCHNLIDLAYGTPSNRLSAEGTAQHPRLTQVDRRTLEPTFLRLVTILTEALAPNDTPQARIEMLVAPFQLALPKATESALICELTFPLTGQLGGVTVVLFSPVLENLDTTASASGQDTARDLATHLKTAHVDLVANLGSTQMLVAELAALQVGDLLWLNRSTHEELPVLIEDQVKFLAKPHQRNGTLGLKIVGRVP